jgi:hypothetical protein
MLLRAAGLLLCGCGGSPGTRLCTPASERDTGVLSSDLIGEWEDTINPGATLTFSGPDSIVAREGSSVVRTGRWSVQATDLTVQWDRSAPSRPEPVFVSNGRLGLQNADVQCLSTPPPPFCSAYQRVHCDDGVTRP